MISGVRAGRPPPEGKAAVARELGETSIAFLTHSTLTGGDIDRWRTAIDEVFNDASA